tara:strand:+ start:204 stop:551 length:348 start_codon:yes stop_codon:yes gene_type:complete
MEKYYKALDLPINSKLPSGITQVDFLQNALYQYNEYRLVRDRMIKTNPRLSRILPVPPEIIKEIKQLTNPKEITSEVQEVTGINNGNNIYLEEFDNTIRDIKTKAEVEIINNLEN